MINTRFSINKLSLLSVALCALSLGSCREKEAEPEGDYTRGAIVVNQGNYFSNNGTLGHFNREDNVAKDDIFQAANGSSLNAGVQGYTEAGEYGIILADHTEAGRDRIEIVDKYTFRKVATIGAPDIENPVNVLAINDNKVYVSCWGTTGVFPNFYANPGYIVVIDLTTKTITKKIELEKGVDKMAVVGDEVYVGSSDYSAGLLIVNSKTDAVVDKLPIGMAPQPIGVDATGMMWVNSGIGFYKINPSTRSIVSAMNAGTDPLRNVSNFIFTPDRQQLIFNYFTYNSNGAMEGSTISLPIESNAIDVSKPLIKRTFNSLNLDPMQGLLYGSVVPSYTQGGYLVRFYMNGDVKDSVKVGIAPKQVYFK